MSKVIGATVGMGLPKPNLKQSDPEKGDYVKGKDAIPQKVSQLENDAGYLTEHQDISGKLDASELPNAINSALTHAKASGEFDGKDGVTPTINTVRDEILGCTNVEIVDGEGVKKFTIYDGYTPQKKIDYFTDEERNDMEAETYNNVYNAIITSDSLRRDLTELVQIYIEYDLLGGEW